MMSEQPGLTAMAGQLAEPPPTRWCSTSRFQALVGDEEALYRAWSAIRSSRDEEDEARPASFLAIERHLAEHIEALSAAILADTWVPQDLEPVRIPKADGGIRELRVPPLVDRLVERSIVDVLTPVLDPLFTPWSFAYRRGLGTDDALRTLAQLRDEGYRWVIRTDFRHCFDALNRTTIMRMLTEECDDPWILATVARLMERPDRGMSKPPALGIPQGGPLSPLLMNLALDAFDRDLLARGFPLVRYADDVTVMVDDPDLLGDALEATRRAARRAEMTLHADKTKAAAFDDGFFFLGDEVGPVYPPTTSRSHPESSQIPRTLYVTDDRLGVRVKTGHLRVFRHDSDETVLSVPLAFVAQVVLIGSVSLSAGARSALLDRDITVSMLSRRGRWLGRMEGGSAQRAALRRRQYALDESPTALEIARAMVTAKIDSQAALLSRYGRRVDAPRLNGTASILRERRRAARSATSRNVLMGVEGAAAKEYFPAFGILLPEWTGFSGRNRRPPKDPANAALSYAYAILTAEATSAIELAGLDPAAGLFHKDSDNRPSLALDLMEEFRPLIVDTAVLSLFRRKRLTAKHFHRGDGRGVSMSHVGRKRLMAGLEERLLTTFSHVPSGKTVTYRRAILLQAQQLASLIEGRRSTYEPVIWRS